MNAQVLLPLVDCLQASGYTAPQAMPENHQQRYCAARVQVASAAAGCEFNACLLNAYRIGSEFAAWHADDDPWLDAAAPIASISLGAERDFLVRPKVQNAARQPEDFDGADVAAFRLRHGSMLVMEAGAQEGWRHALPPCADAGARVNLTFRRVDPARVHLQHDGRTLKQNWGS